MNKIPSELLKFGAREIEKPTPRLILGVDGLDKSGKSRFACTAPGPIVYLNADKATDDVAVKFTSRGKIIHEIPLRKSFSALEKYTPQVAKGLVENFTQAYLTALSIKEVRTVVIDTASEVYGWFSMSLLGVDSQPPQGMYGKLYSEWLRVVYEAYDHDKNVIWLHRLKDEYDNTTGGAYGAKKTGFMKRVGYKDMAYAVQANILLMRDLAKDGTNPGAFVARIYNSSHNADAAGEEFRDSEISFQSIANTLMDEDPKVWLCKSLDCKVCHKPKKIKKVEAEE